MLPAQFIKTGGKQRGDEEKAGNGDREQVGMPDTGQQDQVTAQPEQ